MNNIWAQLTNILLSRDTRQVIYSILAFALAIAIAIVSYLFYYQNFISDDVYIFLCNAKNIYLENSYKCNGYINYSSTSFLYPYILVLIKYIFFDDIVKVSRSASIIFGLASIALIVYALRSKYDSKTILLIAASLIVNPFLLRWIGSGMESMFAGFVLLVIFLMYDKKISLLITTIISSFAIAVRPEFLCVGPILIWYSSIKNLTKFLYLLIWFLFVYIVFIVIHSITGQYLPNSFYGKVASAGYFNFDSVVYNTSVLLITFFSLILYFIYAICKKRKFFEFGPDLKIIITVFFLYALKSKLFLSRYYLYYLPMISYGAFKNVIVVKYRLLLLWVFITFAYSVLLTFFIIGPASKSFADNFQQTYQLIADKINSDVQTRPVNVWATDVGVLSYYSNGFHVCDPVGLVDSTRYKFKSDDEYFEYCSPKYVVTRGGDLTDGIESILNIKYSLWLQYDLGSLGIADSQTRIVSVYIRMIE